MRGSRGATLIELVMFIVILGITSIFIVSQFAAANRNIPEPHKRSRALALAQGVMDEILEKKWDENTPTGGGCVATASGLCATGPAAAGIATEEAGRADYDDIDDYNAIASQSPPQDVEGNGLSQYQGYTLSVSVTQPAAAWNGIPGPDVRLIRVTVASTAESLTLQAYRSNF